MTLPASVFTTERGTTKAPYRLLVISGAFPPIKAPESAHTLFLCEQLAQRGLDVHLLTSRAAQANGPLPSGLSVHPLMASWRWQQLPRLAKFVRAIGPDAILLIYIDWIYRWQPMITFCPTMLRRLLPPGASFVTQFENENGLSGARNLGMARNWPARWIGAWLAGGDRIDKIYGTLLRDSTEIITLSERHLEAFERVQPGLHTKATVIPAPPIMRICPPRDGAARQQGRRMLAVRDEEVLFAYFGFIYPMKGVETLIRAFGRLPPSSVGPRLVIVGDSLDAAYAEELRQIARQAGAADRVLWTGHCEPEAVDASLYLHAADICVLPFAGGVRLNNSSIAVAATHGLPIITTRGEKLEDAFIDRENVCLCPPSDPVALANAMTELLLHPQLRARLSAGARRLAQEWFSWEHVIDSTLHALGAERFSRY